MQAQLDAQKHETRAARETLAEAEAEMDGIHFEKKQLVAQWRSCITAIERRDEALKVWGQPPAVTLWLLAACMLLLWGIRMCHVQH